jgi:hypothetical protein
MWVASISITDKQVFQFDSHRLVCSVAVGCNRGCRLCRDSADDGMFIGAGSPEIRYFEVGNVEH